MFWTEFWSSKTDLVGATNCSRYPSYVMYRLPDLNNQPSDIEYRIVVFELCYAILSSWGDGVALVGPGDG